MKRGVLLSHYGIYSSVSLADFNLKTSKINRSLLRRRWQLGRRPSSLLCIRLQGFGLKEGKLCADEAFVAALERFHCSARTLCIYTWHALHLRLFQGGNPGRTKGASEHCTAHEFGFIVFI